MTAIHRACLCGRTYAIDAWRELPLVDVQPTEFARACLELRTCDCGRQLSGPRPQGRPRAAPSEDFTVRLPQALAVALRDEAKRRGVSRTELARQILKGALT